MTVPTMTIQWKRYFHNINTGYYLASAPNPGSMLPNMTLSGFGDTAEEAWRALNQKQKQLGQSP